VALDASLIEAGFDSIAAGFEFEPISQPLGTRLHHLHRLGLNPKPCLQARYASSLLLMLLILVLIIRMPPQKRSEKEPAKNAPQAKRAKRGLSVSASASAPTVEGPQALGRTSPPRALNERCDVRTLIPYGNQPVDPSIAKLLMTALHNTHPVAKYVNQKAAKLFQDVRVSHSSLSYSF
jgi:hypothetical protein